MKIFFMTIALLLLPLAEVFAHEGEEEITNLAKSDWFGPIVAIIIITGAIVIARIIRKRPTLSSVGGSNSKIINNNNTT